MTMGRPRIWKDPEDLKKDIMSYFESLKVSKDMPTKAGLAFHLDTNKSTLRDYEKRDDYGHYIDKAYQAIEIAWSQRLAGSVPTGAIFYLKAAFHYKDRIDHTSDDKPIEGNKIIFENFNKEGETEKNEAPE